MIKPDGIKRNLIGKIISYLENDNLKIVGLKIIKPTREIIEKHYSDSLEESITEKALRAGVKVKNVNEYGKGILKWLRDFMMSSPVIVMVIKGENAIERARKIVGYTDPAKAEKGTIRGDFGEDSVFVANSEGRPVKNLIHASGNKEEAEKEINLWFNKEGIVSDLNV